jgi:acetyl-CoA carboxylase biotin carboxyl carrier protein
MDIEKLKAILGVLEGTQVSRLDWTSDGQSLRIEFGSRAAVQPAVSFAPAQHLQQGPFSLAPHVVPGHAPAPQASPPPQKPVAKGFTVDSPFVGTFYRCPSPDAPPFVDVGSIVRKGQVLCIVEAMKLMNEIEVEASGRVLEVLVQNGSPVEFGEPLFRLEPI